VLLEGSNQLNGALVRIRQRGRGTKLRVMGYGLAYVDKYVQ